ncbi:acyl-CoA dehydrogenase family protein [Micromonospora sp. NBC_00821]|uniref:acyl-CoA dehydrogenase family protein n=1 Tax=Micromonospora sp. NBC_00821 TaxID=2975977 RepID=UPI003FA584C7
MRRPALTDPGFPPVPEPDLTPADLIARAEAMVPQLLARQSEVERRTFYGEDVHEMFRDAGFYRITVPRRYGGYEFEFETFLRVVMILARGCPSTAWMFCLGAAHSLVTAMLFEEKAQDELFRGGDFIAPAVIAPGGTATRSPDGGWIIDGTWNYCSGIPYATHFIGHAMVAGDDGEPPHPLLFIAPRGTWTRLDDWGGQLGLKGSGSHSVRFDRAEIPDHFGLEHTHLGEVSVTSGTSGSALHAHPQYGGAPMSSMCLEGATLGVGIAQGALEAYGEVLSTRRTSTPPITLRVDDPDYQRWFGQATAMISAAEAITLSAIRQWHDLTTREPAAFTLEEDLRIAMICREAAELAWRGVEAVIQPTAGTSSVTGDGRLERVWRDLSTCHSHAGFAVLLTTALPRVYTQAHFGRLTA